MSGKKNIHAGLTETQKRMYQEAVKKAEENRKRREEIKILATNISDKKIAQLRALLGQKVQGLSAEINKIAEEQTEKLKNLVDNFDKSIEEVREQIEQDRKDIQTKINAIEIKEGNHRNIAEFWLKQTRAYFSDIEQYRHELFTPNQLSRLRLQINQVNQDMGNEAYQSAISSARTIFNQAMELRERVIRAEIEWANYHMQFQQSFAELKSNLYYHQTLQFIVDTDCGKEQVDANIDYWTGGKLSIIADETEKIAETTRDINSVSTAQLISLIETISSLNTGIEGVCAEAQDALISSQIRTDIANNMIEHLQMAGWEYVGHTFEGNEINAALHIKFKDISGNEMVTIISPESVDGKLANNMEINFFDYYNNDKNQRGIWVDGIINSLQSSGINVDKPVTVPGYEVKESDNKQILDIDATASKKAEQAG